MYVCMYVVCKYCTASQYVHHRMTVPGFSFCVALVTMVSGVGRCQSVVSRDLHTKPIINIIHTYIHTAHKLN